MQLPLWKAADRLWAWWFFLMAPSVKEEWLEKFGDVTLSIRGGTSDVYVSKEIFRWKSYPLTPRGVVIDLGANIGAFSLFAAQTARTVYAFEPSSDNYAQLLKNIAANRFSNIVPIRKAVGGANGAVDLYRASANKGSSSIVSVVSRDSERVEVVTLEKTLEICGVDHVDLLKVDIEGSEFSLFENASLEILERIDQIEMEVHPIRGKRIEDIEKRLAEAGFTTQRKRNSLSILGFKMLFASRNGDLQI